MTSSVGLRWDTTLSPTGLGGDSRYGMITIACLQTKKTKFKNYFYAKLKDRQMVKNRVYAKIHTREIKLYYSSQIKKLQSLQGTL